MIILHNTQTIYRLLNVFNSLVLGRTIVNEIESSITTEYQIESETFCIEDASLIIGEKNGKELAQIWSNFRFEQIEFGESDENEWNSVDSDINLELLERIQQEWRK